MSRPLLRAKAIGRLKNRPVATRVDRVPLQDTQRATMFFDGGCPLCRREVAHYQKLDTAKRIRWVNIDTEPEALEALSIAPTDAMRRLHVLTPEGKVVSGARAFATIWSELPYYRRLSNVLQRLHILQPLELCYELFARWRFRRRVKTLSKNRK